MDSPTWTPCWYYFHSFSYFKAAPREPPKRARNICLFGTGHTSKTKPPPWREHDFQVLIKFRKSWILGIFCNLILELLVFVLQKNALHKLLAHVGDTIVLGRCFDMSFLLLRHSFVFFKILTPPPCVCMFLLVCICVCLSPSLQRSVYTLWERYNKYQAHAMETFSRWVSNRNTIFRGQSQIEARFVRRQFKSMRNFSDVSSKA